MHKDRNQFETLSARQWEVFEMVVGGHSDKEIAIAFQISLATVGTHFKRIFKKLQVNTRARAVAIYTQSLGSTGFPHAGLAFINAYALSPRQLKLMALLAQGHSFKEIAAILQISIKTVETHTARTYSKLRVHSRGQAVSLYSKMASRDR